MRALKRILQMLLALVIMVVHIPCLQALYRERMPAVTGLLLAVSWM